MEEFHPRLDVGFLEALETIRFLAFSLAEKLYFDARDKFFLPAWFGCGME